MADFVPTTVNKTAVRDLATPIATVTSFNTLVQSVIADNPFGCIGYTGSDGVLVDPVVRNREHYTLMSELRRRADRQAPRDCLAPVPDDRPFEANAAEVLDNAALATAMGATDALRNGPGETYYAQLKCHDTSGDDYYVTFTKKTVRISSGEDDAIRTAVETWADGVPALA